MILNETQKQVITHVDGPVMVLAGAGSGKTRTLVSRVIYLLEEKKISPYKVLAMTFSNKAAREMKERIATEVDFDIGTLQITTFHSFCARLLRNESEYIGLSKNFTIYDDSESKTVVKSILKRRGVNPKDVSPFEVMYYIDDLKNNGYYLGGSHHAENVNPEDDFFSIFKEYETELHKANAIDFGGLLTGVLELFEKHPKVLEHYRNKYSYVLVDEYQDTNRVQFEIVRKLSEQHRNICVVGDEDQSIYSWRGADIRNIMDFEKVFKDVKIFKLEQNYRSSGIIIEAAAAVISRNRMRKGKTMWTANSKGDAVDIIECADEKNEADFVVKELCELKDKDVLLKDTAIFYRTNSQSRVIEDHLRRQGIPYRIVGGIKFYERKEIKDLIAYLRLIVNEKDSLAFSRIINIPTRGIGATTLRKLEDISVKNQNSLWETVVELVNNSEKYFELKLSARIKSALDEFVHLIEEAKYWDKSGVAPSKVYEKVLHSSGYIEHLKTQKDYESLNRIENLDELLNAISDYEETSLNPNIVSFLETINLDSNHEENSLINENLLSGEVSLMTVHGAKGLEFNYVFVMGAEENLFPSYRSVEEAENGLEEERRLFYVAMTRAMKKLYILFAQARMLFGQYKFNGPSRFLSEIPEHLVNWKRWGIIKNSEDAYHDFDDDDDDELRRSRLVDDEAVIHVARPKSKFNPGVTVIHTLYGEGLVLETSGVGKDEKVLVKFKDGSKRKFMATVAPLMTL